MHLVGNVLVLDGFVQSGQTPESLFVIVCGVLGHEVGAGAIQWLTVLRDRIGEIPNHSAGLGIAEGMATMVFHEHADHAARRIGFPIFAFSCFGFGFSEFTPPAQFFEQHVVEFGIAGGDVGTLGVRAVFRQQGFTFALDTKVGAEVTAAFHDVFGGVVQIGGTWVFEFGCAVARPWQTEIVIAKVVTCFLVFAALGFERFDIKQMHVAHVRFEAFWALAGVANGPDAFVDFTQDVFWHRFVHAFDFLHFVVLDQLFAKAQFVGQLVHDHVVRAAFPQRIDDLLAPLQRAIGRRARTAGFKLCGCGQQVHRAIGIQIFWLARHGGHASSGGRIGIDHHQQVELVHGALHFQTTCLRIGGMAPIEHTAQVAVLINEFVFLEHTIDPARHRDAVFAHHGRAGVAALDPFKVNIPSFGKVLPRAFSQPIVARQ